MRYLLDTNIAISCLKDPTGRLAGRISRVPPAEISVCSVVIAELYYGALKYREPMRRRAALDGFLSPFLSLPFDDEAAKHYAKIRHQLETEGRVIGGNDLVIAAIAISHDLTVVTNNTDEFQRVDGLRVEDWVSPP